MRDGDGWLVNGQKVWNTLGDVADWCELLVRTDPDAPRHRGISCLLVDMKLPGIEVRPIVTITGETEFSEIFLNDVRVPGDALLGPENQGWRVAMTTLNNERGGVATLHLAVREKIRELCGMARELAEPEGGAAGDASLRRSLARLYLDGEYLKLLSDRAVSAAVHGRAGAEGALVKLVWERGLAARSWRWRATCWVPTRWRARRPRARLRARPVHRRRHHPGEQERRGPAGAGSAEGALVDFEFSEEQELLGENVRRFLEEAAPMAWVREQLDGDRGTTDAVWKGWRSWAFRGSWSRPSWEGPVSGCSRWAWCSRRWAACCIPAPSWPAPWAPRA